MKHHETQFKQHLNIVPIGDTFVPCFFTFFWVRSTWQMRAWSWRMPSQRCRTCPWKALGQRKNMDGFMVISPTMGIFFWIFHSIYIYIIYNDDLYNDALYNHVMEHGDLTWFNHLSGGYFMGTSDDFRWTWWTWTWWTWTWWFPFRSSQGSLAEDCYAKSMGFDFRMRKSVKKWRWYHGHISWGYRI